MAQPGVAGYMICRNQCKMEMQNPLNDINLKKKAFSFFQ